MKIVRISAVGAVLAAALVFVGLGNPAAARSRADSAPSPQPPTVEAHAATASPERVRDFWTPERIAAARPAALPANTQPAVDGDRPAGQAVADEILSEPAIAENLGPRHAPFSYNTGKLYYFDPRTETTGWCSASTVNSGSKRLVLTAAHCIHAGDGSSSDPGTWFEYLWFRPGYQNGPGATGDFDATYWATTTRWTRERNYGFDFGMVVVAPNSYGNVVDAVGGHGLRTSPAENYFAHVVGYPTNRDGGERQWICEGTAWWVAVHVYEIGCDWAGGASGGPWLMDYGDNGYGYATGVTSTRVDLFGSSASPSFASTDFYNLWVHMRDRPS